MTPSSRAQWAGRILSGLALALLAFGILFGLSGAKEAVEGTVHYGYQPHHLPIMLAIEIVCWILYLIPHTAPLGAVLWTGYFGGAVATHLRLDDTLGHTLTPIVVATLLWVGLYLRDERVRNLIRAKC
jgi:hypothetical protein